MRACSITSNGQIIGSVTLLSPEQISANCWIDMALTWLLHHPESTEVDFLITVWEQGLPKDPHKCAQLISDIPRMPKYEDLRKSLITMYGVDVLSHLF